MEKILSIVVPAYNVEKYIRKCLDSFVIEEILNKIEVLVINDGSKDGTEIITKEYCKKYPETFFLYNKENGGHGSGINYGIKYAKGKYFKVVDGDDWLNSQELPAFIKVLEESDCDIVAADYLCIQDVTEKVLQEKKCTTDESQYGRICSMNNGEIVNVIKMHALTIKTEILQRNSIVIDEKCFYVDAEYITYPIPYVDSVYFYKGYIYMYRLGRAGQSVDIKSMQNRRNQHMYVLNRMLEYYSKCFDAGVHNRIYMAKCIAQMVENQFQIYISMGTKRGIYSEMKAWDEELKEKFPEVYSSVSKKSITILRRTNYKALFLGALVYKIVK